MKNNGEQKKRGVPVIEVDKRQLRAQVSEVVRLSVKETLNGLLDAEADALCKARRYERNADRASPVPGITNGDFRQQRGRFGSRAPNCVRFLLRRPVSNWYRRRESPVEEAPVKMYPFVRPRTLRKRSGAAVSVRAPSAT